MIGAFFDETLSRAKAARASKAWSFRQFLGTDSLIESGSDLTWDRYEKVLLELSDDDWLGMINREIRSGDGPVVSGDAWFDELERKLWESGE